MLDASIIAISGRETDGSNTPEDDRPKKKLLEIYTFPGNPDFSREGISGLTAPDECNRVFDADDLDPHNSNFPSPPAFASSNPPSSGERDSSEGSGESSNVGESQEVTPEILQGIHDVVSRYQNFECVECADEIEEYLKQQNIHGRRIKLDTTRQVRDDNYIYDDGYVLRYCLNY
jgi:Papain fold toxin 2